MNRLIGDNSQSSPIFWTFFFLSLTVSFALIFKVTSHSSIDEPLWLLDPPEAFELTDSDLELAIEEYRADLAQDTN